MQTPSTLPIWLSGQAWPLAFVVILLVLMLLLLSLSARWRHKRMVQSRTDVSETTFVNYLTGYGFDARIVRTTYAYLRDHQGIQFPLAAGDLLDEDLGLDGAQVQATIKDLMQISDRLLQPGMVSSPVLTVEDLIRLIQASPRLSELAA